MGADAAAMMRYDSGSVEEGMETITDYDTSVKFVD